MNFVFYELKKLGGARFVRVMVCVLLAANFVCALSAARASYTAKDAELTDFYAVYFADRNAMDEYYRSIIEYERLNSPSSEAGSDGFVDRGEADKIEPEPLPDRYSKNASISDKELFENLYAEIEAAENFSADIDALIKEARTNLAEYPDFGILPDGFTYKYQEKLIEVYSAVRDNVSIGVEHSRGWGGYFAYGSVNIFIFASILLVGTISFAQEPAQGFDIILRASKKGRLATGAAKIAAIALASVAITSAFTASTMLAFLIQGGFSSAGNALQSVSEFRYSPHILTIGEYFAVGILARMLCFTAFAMLTALLSVIFRQYILIYASGGAVWGVSFLLYTIANKTNTSAFCLNLVSGADVSAYADRYRAINLFSNVIDLHIFAVFLCVIAVIGALVAAICLYCKGMLGMIALKMKMPYFFVKSERQNSKKPVIRLPRYTGLLVAEIYKTLISSRLGAVVLCLLVIASVSAYRNYQGIDHFTDEVYREYMETLEGAPSEEKDAYLFAERMEILGIVSARKSKEKAYRAGAIGREEYLEYLDSYNTALAKSDPLKRIEEHQAYLAAKSASGEEAWYLYDSGWLTLFESGGSAAGFAALGILLCGVFAREYNSGSSSGRFANILRVTKKGRGRTFLVKLSSSLIISIALFVLFYLPNLLFILQNYPLPAANAPLGSIRAYTMYSGKMTVGDYAVWLYLLRFCGMILLGLLSAELSCLCERELTAICVTVGVTALPPLAVRFGLEQAEKLSFWQLFSGNPLFIESVILDLFGTDHGFEALFVAVCTAICMALVFFCRRKWCS